jgi:hypothetical protein
MTQPICSLGQTLSGDGAEDRAERKARLRKAAADAIDRAIATGDDPFALMMTATGEGPGVCLNYVRQHPFFLEKRNLFKTADDRKRDRDAAALAAEPGPIVWVRRQFSHHKHAAYRLADVSRWHWSNFSGGVGHRANRYYLHAYVWCDGMIAGEIAHSCRHGPPPHHIKVCITKKGNETFWREIEAAGPQKPRPAARPKRRRRKKRSGSRSRKARKIPSAV